MALPPITGIRRLNRSGRKMSATDPRVAPSCSASGVSGQTWLLLTKIADLARTTAPAARVRGAGRCHRPSHTTSRIAAPTEAKITVWMARIVVSAAGRHCGRISVANGVVSAPLTLGREPPWRSRR